MPGASYKIALSEATERLSKRRGKGSDDVVEALSPEKIDKIQGNEKLGKNTK